MLHIDRINRPAPAGQLLQPGAACSWHSQLPV